MIKLKVKKNESGLKLKEIQEIFNQYFPNYDLTTELQIFADDDFFSLRGYIKDFKPELLARFNKIEHLDPACKDCEIVCFIFDYDNYNKIWKPNEIGTCIKYFKPDVEMIANNIQDGLWIGNQTITIKEKNFSDCNCDKESFNNKLNELAITTLLSLETVVKVLYDEQLDKRLEKIKELKQQKEDLVKKTVASIKAQFDLIKDF